MFTDAIVVQVGRQCVWNFETDFFEVFKRRAMASSDISAL